MKSFQLGILALTATLVLTGARCQSSTEVKDGEIGSVSVTTGIAYDNQPENSLEQIPASASQIYLATEVINPTKSTNIQATWYQLPTTVIASETFIGKRTSNGNRLDFDYQKSVSWLASRVERPGLSWPIGEYRVELRLNGKLAKTTFFSVVSDSEAQQAAVEKIVTSLKAGDTVDDNDQLVGSKTSFGRDTSTIYLSVGVTGAKAGSRLEVAVRYVKDDQVINSFSSIVSGNDTLTFALPRERFGRLWADKLWPVGSFEVTAKLGGVVARTTTFVVRP